MLDKKNLKENVEKYTAKTERIGNYIPKAFAFKSLFENHDISDFVILHDYTE